MNDKEVKSLIELVIEDPDRKDLYLSALPKMTGEEKIDLTLDLWQMMMEKLETKVEFRREQMIEEMAADDTVFYSKDDFDRLFTQVINEYLATRAGVADEDELSRLKSELNNIGKKVEEHDQVLLKFKDKFSEEV